MRHVRVHALISISANTLTMSRLFSFLKNTKPIASVAKGVGRQGNTNSFSRMFGFNQRQRIYVSEIDTEKLLDKLEKKFGVNNFDVHVGASVDQIPILAHLR